MYYYLQSMKISKEDNILERLVSIETKLDYILELIERVKEPMKFTTDGDIMNYDLWVNGIKSEYFKK